MFDPALRGPSVDGAEDLHRFITTPDWWVKNVQPPRPSSAAFDSPRFSLNVASLTTVEESTRQLHEDLNCLRGGIVSFNCGVARGFGFDTRQELDENAPNNRAHAHVYYDGTSSSCKKNARELAALCETVLVPAF
jgi:hypothetical protein